MANVLIIDDDKVLCRMLSNQVERLEHHVVCALTLQEGLAETAARPYDVVFLDVQMPDGSGLDILPQVKGSQGTPEVIIMTASGTLDGAEIAIKNGAWDYLQKPLDSKNIVLSLKRVLQYRESLQKGRKSLVALKLDGIVGNSAAMQSCLDALAQAASSDVNVLLTGETGTGKDVFARAIHANSPRSDKNFVVVDCASLSETLVESTLFGHERGAFTGADKAKEGLVKTADGGSLFLDEIGELPLSKQKSFLRVLQAHRFRPVGGNRELESSFRLIAATNRDLDGMAAEGLFRQDLLFRIRATVIELPPLRLRREDIPGLAAYYTEKICRRYGTEAKGFSPDFLDALYAYGWPGNVRELVNTLESSVSEARQEPILFQKHLPTQMRIKVARSSVARAAPVPAQQNLGSSPREITPAAPPNYKEFRQRVLADAERRYFKELIAYSRGSIKEACRISGLGRTRLYTLMKQHNISRYGWPSTEQD